MKVNCGLRSGVKHSCNCREDALISSTSSADYFQTGACSCNYPLGKGNIFLQHKCNGGKKSPKNGVIKYSLSGENKWPCISEYKK
jgi:hypothetical protein